jgi:hypothetical protein
MQSILHVFVVSFDNVQLLVQMVETALQLKCDNRACSLFIHISL